MRVEIKTIAAAKMRSNFFIVALAAFEIFVLCCNSSCAHPPLINSNKQNTVNTSAGYLIPKFNLHKAQLQEHGQHESKQEQKQQQQKYPDQHPNLASSATLKISSTSTSIPSTAMYATSTKQSLQSAYVYKADVPTHIKPEAHKVVNAVKLVRTTSSSAPAAPVTAAIPHATNTNGNSNFNSETDDGFSKKIIGSSVVTSVSVILNGDEPEFTDALGQKVPKPQPSFQVASPIDLLNPDRYEFYTFDEHGELIKRLMTMEEIQSIVANGDGEGPTIIHHGPIEDRDPEKNVQDIVNSVQTVLNKEVETNKNTSTESFPVFDTPDVSSSWSMILPAIFGNAGNVDIFPHQKPQQIVMTPDSEIIETSIVESVTTTTKKPKPSKKKPGQKRRTTTTTTEMTPQIIQEELDSQESVYTGMQQYQNLAATMQNYDGFSQLHMQPIYHKLPEVEASTRRVFINNQEIVKKPTADTEYHGLVLNESLARKPVSVQHKPLTPTRVKKPNGSHTSPTRPQTNKQKIKKKPASTSIPSTTSTSSSTSVPSAASTTPELTTTTVMESTTTELTTTTSTLTSTRTNTTPAPTTQTTTATAATTPTSYWISWPTSTTPTNPTITTTTTGSTIQAAKQKKKKPPRHPVYTSSTISDVSTQKPHLTAEKRKPSPKPHRPRPKPTQQHIKYPHTTSTSDLTAEGTAHQEISHNKFQHVLYNIVHPKPNKPLPTPTNTTTASSSAVTFSPIPTTSTSGSTDSSLIVQEFSGFKEKVNDYGVVSLTTRITTNKPSSATSANIPSTSGTSGYPVPSIEEPVNSGFTLNKKQPFPSLALTQHLNKPYEQDAHTLISFDQIMQTLKQPEQMTEQMAESSPLSSENNLKTEAHSTLKPPYDDYNENTLATKDFASATIDLVTNIPEDSRTDNPTESEANKNISTADFPSFTAFTDNFVKHTTEYSAVKQQDEHFSPESETPSFASTSNFFEPSTTKNGDETTTNTNHMTEDYTEQQKTETRIPVVLPHKETLIPNGNHDTRPILVADLKPQLNMEVIKPSEQITMSDFQTQAATIASTLVDGVNIIPADYSMMASNDTKDEIAFLMSDVIHQMSNANHIPETQHTSSNKNRYSNQAQLNLSFLMSPNKADVQKTTSSVSDITDKPIYERFDNLQTDQQNGNLRTESTSSYATTTVIPNEELDTESVENTTQTSYTSQEDIDADMCTTTLDHLLPMTSIDTIDSDAKNNHERVASESSDEDNNEGSVKKLDKINTDVPDNNATTTASEERDTNFQIMTESNEEIKRQQQQKEEEERKPLFEADTTTFINILPEEITFLSREKDQSIIKRYETSNSEVPEGSTENENIAEGSMNGLQSEITTLIKDYMNEDDQSTTEISTGTSKEILNLSDIKYAISAAETTGGSDIESTTSSNESETNIAEDTGPNASDKTWHPIVQNSDKNEPTTRFTISKEIEAAESTTFKVEESEDADGTTAINYQMSEETSAELNAMISEEDETDEAPDEDPYIKLGEATTLQPELSSETQIIINDKTSERKPEIAKYAPMSSSKPIYSTIEKNTETGTSMEKYEEADEEDEGDQFGYHAPKLPNLIVSSTTTVTKTTTTPKPKVTTTRRLNTLKPVSYFNKQPAYALYQESVEPLYNKQSSQSLYAHRKENTPTKVATYIISTPQQRPMQRPPQLSNLMISSTQATRPPVKFEPPPFNSKGLEASLTTVDEDILAFAKLCNELAFTYWKSITSEKISSARSLIISPFALTSMLSMVFLGARGSTSGEMNDVLKLDDMVTFNPHLVFKNITDSVEKSMDRDIATTAFVREIYSDRGNGKLLQFFKEKTQQLYAGHVEEVNFHVVNDIIRRRTNLLVKRHTMGKVLEYLRTNSVWVNGPLATISANLFQTDCSYGSTQDRDGEIFFHVHPTVRQRRLVPIPAVLFKNGFTAGYEPNLDATVTAFGRIQDTTSVIYVMPGYLSSVSPSDNLDRLEKQLMETAISKNTWSNLLTSLMDRQGMEVQIPRFSHRSFVNATLGLQKMGLKGLFKSDYADLAGLTGSSNRDIYLSDMIQINTFSTCGEEKIADHHHVEMYPAPPLRKRNKDVDAHDDDEQDSSETIIDFGSLVQDSVLGRGFYDDLLDPKYLELPLPLRPRQARVPDAPRLRFDKPFLYFVRHNPTGMILFMGRFNPRLLP